MRRQHLIVGVLALALISSNLAWLYMGIDHGYAYSYLEDSFRDHDEALDQALALFPLVLHGDANRDEVLSAAITAALPHGRASEPFEKEGFVVVGSLVLRFDHGGKLVEVHTAWDE